MCEKRGQNRVRISDPFLGPCSIGTLSTGSKTAPFLGPRFGRRSTATTFTLELAFGTVKSGGGSNKQCQMQSDNLYVASSHIGSTATKKSRVVPARCMYTLVLAPCSNCGGPLCNGTFSTGFSGSLMNPPNRQKLWDVFNRSCILLPRLLPKSCRHNERFLSAQVRLLFQAYLVVLYRPKQGGRQGTAWRSSTLQDVRQNPSPALKESPRMGTEFGCKICMLCADT